MKLSEIKGERAIEVIADLIEPIATISTDEKCAGLFKVIPKKGEDKKKAAARHLIERVPLILRTHSKEVIKIVAILDDKDPSEMNVFTITAAFITMLNDPALIELFSSAAQSVGQTPPTDTSGKSQE